MKSMAKQMRCRNHEAFRNASAGSVAAKSPSVKCSLPWMLVSICQREPCKVVWKIRQADLSGLRGFRHPKLQEMHKQPTATVSVTEHQSFQIALTWLWQRFAMICTNGKQPKLVEAALQDCPTCQEFFWSGDGTSATESSCNKKAAATQKVAQECQHGTPCRPAFF